MQTLDPSVGGVAPAVIALSRGLVSRGHQSDLLTLDNPAAAWSKHDGLTIHAVGPGMTSYRYSSRLVDWLRQRSGEYDRFVVHGLWQFLSFAIWRHLRGSSTPYYVFPHGMLDPWFKRTFPLKHLKKWLYWPWGEYRVLRDAKAVIFTSEQERLEARKSFWLYRANERISPLGLEAPFETSQANKTFLAQFPQTQNKRLIAFLGRIHPKKGCELLIEAFSHTRARADSTMLVLAGPDQIGWAGQLRDLAARLDVADQVLFTGMLSGDVKLGLLANAEAFVLPSHQENFGLAVVEALATGLPVLISDRVNIWREIDADRAGYVETDDLSGTKRLLERWYETSIAERGTMKSNARKCFATRFEIGQAIDSLLRILNEA